jgi:hypothetical protein
MPAVIGPCVFALQKRKAEKWQDAIFQPRKG